MNMDWMNYRPPFPDELLYGWFLDLAECNFPMDNQGIHRILDFAFPRRRVPSKNQKKEPLRMDYVRGIDSGIRRLQQCGYQIVSPDIIVTYNTPLIASSIAQDKGDQAKVIHTAMADVAGGPFDMPVTHILVRDVRVCPCCMREYPYIRTWHNLPGVTSCAIHDIELSSLFAWQRSKNQSNSRAEEREIAYARYAKTVYDNPSDLNLQDIRTYLSSKGINLTKAKEHMFIAVVSALLDNHIQFCDVLASRSPRPFVSKCSDYSLISQIGALGTFRCSKCTQIWTDAIEAVRIFGCPKCSGDKPSNDRIAEILQQIGDGRYKLTEPFKGMGATQDVLHETCGQVTSARIGMKIWRGTTCTCEHVHTARSLQMKINSIAEGFTVEAYDPIKGVITLRHKCGTKLTPFLTGFRKNPTCPDCKSQERELRMLKKLTTSIGDEYEVVEFPNNGPVRVRHKKCGREIVGRYISLVKGPFCPLCVPYYKRDRANGNVTYEAALMTEMDAWFKHHPLWIAGRHRIGEHTKQYYESLQKLVKKGYVYLLDRGIYSNRTDMSPYDIVRWKYLDDNGVTVGRFTGDTAAYLAHETDIEPDIITLETSLLAHRTHITVQVQGRQVSIKGI